MIARSLLLLFGLLSSHAIGRDFSDDERARLRQREVLIEEATNGEGIHGLRTAFLIKARPEAVWNLLVDYKHKRFREVFKNVEALWVLQEDQKGALVRYQIHNVWGTFQYTLQRDYLQPGRRQTWRRVAGDFRSITGEWDIRKWPDDEHQLIVSESFVDVAFLIPTLFLRPWLADELRNTARLMREQLEPAGK